MAAGPLSVRTERGERTAGGPMVPLDPSLKTRGRPGAALKCSGERKPFGAHTPYRPGSPSTAAATGWPLERKEGPQRSRPLRCLSPPQGHLLHCIFFSGSYSIELKRKSIRFNPCFYRPTQPRGPFCGACPVGRPTGSPDQRSCSRVCRPPFRSRGRPVAAAVEEVPGRYGVCAPKGLLSAERSEGRPPYPPF